MFEINLNQLPKGVLDNTTSQDEEFTWVLQLINAAKTFHGSYINGVVGESPKLVFRDEACYNMFLLRWA